MKKAKVLAITGIRSEYYFQRSVFYAIREHPQLELQLIASGAHLTPHHGHSVREIDADGFEIVERIENLLAGDRDASRLKGAALQLQTLTHIVDRLRPDWLLAPADREEAITMALCGTYLNLPVVHYGAGDYVVGNADDTVRHAVSRLSHLMLTTNDKGKDRLVATGEEPWRVHCVGHAGIDRLRSTPEWTLDRIARELGLDEMPSSYAVVIHHPLSSQIDRAASEMELVLEAVRRSGLAAFVSYPNTDAGSQAMVEVIERYRSTPGFHLFRNIPDPLFVNLMRRAKVLVGNSSCGLLEAPFLRLPAVNVGRRQSERDHAENLRFVSSDPLEVEKAIRELSQDGPVRERARACGSPFGDGQTGPRVAELLASTPRDEKLMNKRFCF